MSMIYRPFVLTSVSTMIYLTLMIEFFDRAKFPEGNDDVLKFLKKWFNHISHKTRKGMLPLSRTEALAQALEEAASRDQSKVDLHLALRAWKSLQQFHPMRHRRRSFSITSMLPPASREGQKTFATTDSPGMPPSVARTLHCMEPGQYRA